LTPDDVARFVALGQDGWKRLREGDAPGAERAFRDQIALCATNPEPFVSLALLAARRAAADEALDRLRDAVVRGFADLPRVERAEPWGKLGAHPRFLEFQDAAARIAADDERWAGWDAFREPPPPADVEEVARDRVVRAAVLDGMAPALGERHTRLWHRLNDRRAASRLEAYVAARADAPDLDRALDRLIELYAGPNLDSRWPTSVAPGTARRLRAVAEVALARFESGPVRAGGLLCAALAETARRDRRGDLSSDAVDSIRASLDEIVAEHPDSPLLATAVEGLVRTDVATGDLARARATFASFAADRVDDRATIADLRRRLGTLALLVGDLPDFRATTLAGAELAPGALRGKVVVLDFWATWCGPCVEGIPTLRKIHDKHGDRVAIVGVSLDRDDELPDGALREWIAAQAVPGEQIRDGLGWESDLIRAFGVREIPFSVLIRPDGTVGAVDLHGRRLEKAVDVALREGEGDAPGGR